MNSARARLLRDECALLCASRSFRSSQRTRDLLRHLVECTVRGDRAALSQRRLALDFFERSRDFDPETDSIVRVEMSKLRRSLREFYQANPRRRAVVISIHPSNYSLVADFAQRFEAEAPMGDSNGDGTNSANPSTGEPPDPHRLDWLSDSLREELSRLLRYGPSRYLTPTLHDLVTCDSMDPLGEDIDIFECTTRFNSYMHNLTDDTYHAARNRLEEVLRQKPDNALVLSMLGDLRRAGHTLGFARDDTAVQDAFEMHLEAVGRQPGLLSCQVSYGLSLLTDGRTDEVKQLAWSVAGDARATISLKLDAFMLLALAGEWQAGKQGIEGQMAQLEGGPVHFDYITCLANYEAGDYETANRVADRLNPSGCFWESVLKAASGGQLHKAEAEAELEELYQRRPDFETRGREYLNAFIPSEKTVDRLLDGVRKAGLRVS